jgi:hypothetical protein
MAAGDLGIDLAEGRQRLVEGVGDRKAAGSSSAIIAPHRHQLFGCEHPTAPVDLASKRSV